MLYDKRNSELLKKDTAMLKKLQEECDKLVKENQEIYEAAVHRKIAIDNLEIQVEEIDAKGTAFSRSVKKAAKKLRDDYYRTIFIVVFILLILFSLGYLTRK